MPTKKKKAAKAKSPNATDPTKERLYFARAPHSWGTGYSVKEAVSNMLPNVPHNLVDKAGNGTRACRADVFSIPNTEGLEYRINTVTGEISWAYPAEYEGDTRKERHPNVPLELKRGKWRVADPPKSEA